MYCQTCGSQMPQGAQVCPRCGILATEYQATISASSGDATYVSPPPLSMDDKITPPSSTQYGSSPYDDVPQNLYNEKPYSASPGPYSENPYAPVAPPPPPRKGSPVVVGLIAIIVLLMIGGSAGFVLLRNGQTSIATSATATARSINEAANVNATASASANATASANVTPTANITATANAYYTLFDTTTSSVSPTRDDPLSNNSKGWQWDESQDCAFIGGAYQVSNAQSSSFRTCMAHQSGYGNFLFEVQMTIIKGSYGSIVFRSDDALSNFYIFRAGQDGVCTVAVYRNGVNAELLHAPSMVFKQGPNQTNMLAVLAQGSHLIFYVNAQYLFDLNDTTLSSGKIGLVAGSIGDPSEVVYRNAKIWVLS